MTERQIQSKILKHLEEDDIIAVKTIMTNKSGVLDILACAAKGRFLAIEVKTEKGKLSELQRHKINQYIDRGAIAFVAYGWDDFLAKYQELVYFERPCPKV